MRVDFIAARGSRGMTMVEVMIAMVILLFVAIALVETITLTIDVNMKAALMDTGVRVAEENMSRLRNVAVTAGVTNGTNTVIVRNFPVAYAITNTVSISNTSGWMTPFGGSAVINTSGSVALVNTLVEWQWRGQGSGDCKNVDLAGSKCYSHLLSVVRPN